MSERTDPGYGADDIELYDESREYTAIELCRVCRLPHERLVEYVVHGVVQRGGTAGTAQGGSIETSREIGPEERFTHVELRRLVRAVRVRRELEIELPNLALVVDLLDRLEGQRRELERLRREVGARSGA